MRALTWQQVGAQCFNAWYSLRAVWILPSMNAEQLKDRLRAVLALRERLPGMVGEEARGFFLDKYRKGGFEDDRFVPWVARKTRSGKAGKRDAGRALLVQSGRLRRSIRVLSTGPGYVVVGSDVFYAKFHNEGVEGRLPRRQFIGPSKKLAEVIERRVISEVLKVLQ